MFVPRGVQISDPVFSKRLKADPVKQPDPAPNPTLAEFVQDPSAGVALGQEHFLSAVKALIRAPHDGTPFISRRLFSSEARIAFKSFVAALSHSIRAFADLSSP